MENKKQAIKNIIEKVLSEEREPLKDILDHNDSEDVQHAMHSAWEGGEMNDVESENLVMPVDHGEVTTGMAAVRSPEVLNHPGGNVTTVDDRPALSMNEAQLRDSIRNILSRIL